MGATLSLDRDPVLEIPDAEGQVFFYRLARCPPGLDDWACWVRHADDSGPRYRVATDQVGRWSCACPDWRYRHSRQQGDLGCKHIDAVRPLYGLMVNLMRREAEVRS